MNNISETYNAIPGQGYVKDLTDAFFIRERAYNFYGQDSWRVRPNLTVIAGVRWEVGSGAGHGQQAHAGARNGLGDVTPYGALFQTNSSSFTYNDLLANLSSSTQLVPAGSSNGKPFLEYASTTIFAPSIGVAWQPDPKTVVRSGYSISYVRDTLTLISNVTTSNLGLHTGVAVTPSAGDPLAVLNPNVNQVLPAARRSPFRNRNTRTSWRASLPRADRVSMLSIPI